MTPAEATPLLIDALRECYYALLEETDIVDAVGSDHAERTPDALRTACDLLLRLGVPL